MQNQTHLQQCSGTEYDNSHLHNIKLVAFIMFIFGIC